MNRREFLRGAAAGAALTTAMGSFVPLYAQSKPRRVGLIGPGWYGKSAHFRLLQIEPVEVVALCDVDKRMVAQAAEMVATRQKSKKTPPTSRSTAETATSPTKSRVRPRMGAP
jgi:predicted homoserine dehydrogenase-like protein